MEEPPHDHELIAELIAALDGDVPEACLADAIGVLRTRGLSEPCDASVSWLEVVRGGRKIVLAAEYGVSPPGPRTRTLVEHLLGVALARAVAHDEARHVSERLEMLSAASAEGIMIHDEGVVVDCNQRLCELLGYDRAEMLDPLSMVRTVAPEDLERARERIRQRVEGEFVHTVVRKDGTRFRAEFCTKQTRLGDRPLRVVALRDVTARERTAELLRESEARLRRILEATFDCVVFIRDGAMVDVSDGAERFFGRPREQLIGRPALEMVAPAHRAEVLRHINEQIVGSYEAAAIGASGEHVPVMVVSVSATLNGEPVRVAALRDLSAARLLEQERRRLELQVERSQRLESLGVLASGIAHDFNNLLVGVLGGAEVLLATLRDPEERELAETIRVAGERAASLTRKMLAYAGRRNLTTTEPVDLATLLHELRDLLDAALSKKAHLQFELDPNSVVVGERATLTQVFMNLLTNASDALEDKPGEIFVSTERVRDPDARYREALGAPLKEGDWVLVKVRDTGVGMDQATLRRIFEPFFSTKPRGHGLGLGSCLGIVKAHGGAILVESAPKVGSTFSVLLPATEATARSTTPDATVARPCRVLIVDDEPLVRAHLRRSLESRGFSVHDAPDGRAGLDAIQRSEPDLVLLDLTMPDLDGVEVLRRLRASGSRVPVVLCSGNLDFAKERGLDPAMIQGTLHKPFKTEDLLEVIDRARGPIVPPG